MSHLPRPEVDLHVHTVASGHAYSTLAEVAAAAARRGLRGVGMTDHGPGLPGGPHPYHFMALRFVPRQLDGVRVLRGIEANILAEGRVDLDDDLLGKLDLVMAGFHEECGFDGRGEEANTRVVLALMDNPLVRVITHPGNPNFPLDYETVARRGAQTGTALEINNSSFTISRKGSSGNCSHIARLCARHGTPVAIGSDAHFHEGVGEFAEALLVAAEAGVKPEQIVNRTLESTLAFLGLEV
ncbi:MAG: phosphatase [Desulfuromonas sp.]|mgnify:CR=1 FL=1|uniref:PHP domain-containing protein n=1 Tax=Desulfuromonas sp. TaxID=892 RepID=UPI000CB7C409|nr:PHP domain-containing protein [Desulfuromonas sp.]PLX84915.1 MAG: phosphatase [Desulfuromonas sp.]